MSWFAPRALVALAPLLGGLCGVAVAVLTEHTVVAAGLGVLLGLLLLLVSDTWRGSRLLRWLRGPQLEAAPRDAGPWGEIAYRFERALRSRDEALRLQHQRLEQFLSAIEASPNGVLLLDAGNQIDWCNAVAAEHFGLDPARDRRQRVTHLVRAPAFVDYLHSGSFGEATTFASPSGRMTLSVLVRPYGDGLKLVLTQDITERERSEAMRRDFVANVSHEIRTPLTVLSGFVQTLAELALSESERTRVLVVMQQQTDRMQALVADLLSLAQLEGSPRPGAENWVAVSALMRRAMIDATTLSAGRHAVLADGGEDAELAGSEAELLSALLNLLGNAVRYTLPGGQVTLHWRWRDDGSGEFDVADTGIGIAREHLPRLTERFYRVDGSRSRDTGGTGLGLAIVKHVVQRHGGEIDVRSEPGKGSSFRLVFPAVRLRRCVSPEAVAAALV